MKKIISLIAILTFTIFMSGCREENKNTKEENFKYIQVGDECFITYEYDAPYAGYAGYGGYGGIANIDCENVNKDIIVLELE